MTKPPIRYEDAAEQRTVTGWTCKTCHRFWGTDEHMSRYCCATELPCECGNRTDKFHIRCESCRKQREDERWAKALAEAAPWDGETPLYSTAIDRYFFDADAIEDYLEDRDDAPLTAEDLRLVLCEPTRPPQFAMEDFLCDNLPDDDHGGHNLDFREIDKVVNDWIAAHMPIAWESTGNAVIVGAAAEAVAGSDG